MKNLIFCFCLLISVQSLAQNADEYNPNSLRPVNKYDQFMKRTIWYRLNLKEKQNQPFFAQNNEITKIIINAVKNGIIRPFENDSLKERMPFEKFLQNLTVYGTSNEEENGDGWQIEGAEEEEGASPTEKPKMRIEHFPKDLSILDIREDLIFSKRESRMIHDIQAVTIVIPAHLHPANLEYPLATFSYKELVQQVFRENPEAIWYNNENPAEHRNIADAFELRLFRGHIFKFANLDDESLADRYGNDKKGAVNASLQFEYLMQDFENDLWEY